MYITDSQLTLGSSHVLEESSVYTSTLERIRDPAAAEGASGRFEQVLNKMMGAHLQRSTLDHMRPCCRPPQQKHAMLEAMFAMLFGADARTSSSVRELLTGTERGPAGFDPALLSLNAPRPRWQLTQTLQRKEMESSDFAASGKVCLADGSQRQFEVGFHMERSEELSKTVSKTLFDQLVIDCAAPKAGVAGDELEFDLNCDGTPVQMRLPGGDSAFLFLDRNHNGQADDGSELFGPQSGNGFAELARLDSDNNGWIDSADPAFADLMLWQSGAVGSQQVQGLAATGIGALATAAVATPFALKAEGEQVGQMRSSSIWLGETGGAGTIRQVDVATRPVTETAGAGTPA